MTTTFDVDMGPEVVSEAVILHSGRGLSPFPLRDAGRLALRFGPGEAADLAVIVDRLSREFYEVEPEAYESLEEAADPAVEAFAVRHPELSAEAISAIRWCYTYDWK